MKKRLLLLAAFLLSLTWWGLGGSLLSAQSYIWHLKKAEDGKGVVTIKMDNGLEYVIDNRVPENIVDTLPNLDIEQPVVAKKKPRYDTIKTKPKMPEFAFRRKMIVRSDSSYNVNLAKKIMSNTKKVPGYRVQLFAGGNTREDRQKAEAIGKKAKALFPNEPIYTHFYSPRWVCRMGNYESLERAQAVLKRVRQSGISGASLIKGMITVKK